MESAFPVQPQAHGIIPARYASTRFPGKPLTPLLGKPMFWHVWHRASQCPQLASVTLATDDERIAEAAAALAVPVVMTSCAHISGTDRAYEAATLLGIPVDSLIVNIQGDEPALDPHSLTELLSAFADPVVQVATLARRLSPEHACQPDIVKVVCAINGDALYFSRAAIPFARDPGAQEAVLGHIGLYAFTMQALARFVALPVSPLEEREKLEQLRLLENGIAIRVVRTLSVSHGVDTEGDIAIVLPLLNEKLSFQA